MTRKKPHRPYEHREPPFARWMRSWKEHVRSRHKKEHHWDEHEPPFAHWSRHWEDHDLPFAEWPEELRRKRAPFFLRFVSIFGLVASLMLAGLGTLAFLVSRLLGGGWQAAGLVWLGGVALGLPIFAIMAAYWAFRRIATPLSDVMQAVDVVAEGDLNVRVPVPERGPREFRRLAQSFNRMTEELQRAEQQRRNLTADVAHELRTPLHIIQGNLEGVLDEVYEPTEEHITATLNETRTLARLVEDLRTLSLAEAGQLPMEWEDVDITELLIDVETSFGGQAEAAGIDLRVETEGDQTRMMVRGDVGRLEQVLGNLMGNALRHTPSGGAITLRVEPAGGGVRITVWDTGEGIPSEDQPYVFERFWRGERSRSHAGGVGSGLGLPIVRQLVQAHGGTIEVESEVGKGTVFVIELPA